MGSGGRGIPRLLFIATLTVSIFAQDQEVNTREAPVTFSTGVNLVPVKVVVRDKDGRTVGNLERADFELRDNGKIQNISRFSVEKNAPLTASIAAAPVNEAGIVSPDSRPRAAAAPSAIPEHFIGYVFDDVHTDIADLMRSRAAAVRHMAEAIDESTRVAIFTISGQTKLDFTDDLDQAQKTLNSIRRWSSDQGNNDCPAFTYYWADLIVNHNDAEAINAAEDELKGCIVTNMDPTSLAQMVRSLANAWLARGQRETRLGLEGLETAIRRLTAMPGSRTLVYVSSGFLIESALRPEQNRLFDQAIRSGVTINTLDARGLYAGASGPNIEQMPKTQTPAQVIFQQRLQKETMAANTNVLGELANATGGTFVWNDNDYDAGLRRLAAAPEQTYVLAFAPTDLKNDGKFHSLKVTLRDHKELELFARSGYYAPNAAATAEEDVREEIRDAVFSRQEQADLPMDLSLQYFKTNDIDAQLTIVAKLDISRFGFRKADDRNNDVVTVVSAIFDRNGNFIKGVQRVIDLKLRDETLKRLLAQGGISVRTTLELQTGSYLVRVVARDGGGAAIASRNGSVEIPY